MAARCCITQIKLGVRPNSGVDRAIATPLIGFNGTPTPTPPAASAPPQM